MGVLWEPYQIKKIAKAKAEAAKIEAQGEIEITDMTQRALRRWIAEETQYQQNMEAITAAALPDLNEEADPGSMDNDWLVNFFDKGRKISDDEMQGLWARILSGEANAPGVFSKRTVNCVAELEKSDAEMFTRFCGFVWQVELPTPLVFNDSAAIYMMNGIDFDSLHHLESIGFIKHTTPSPGFVRYGLPKRCVVTYYDRRLTLELPTDAGNVLNVGNVLFTRAGMELATLCGSQPVEGFWEYVMRQWTKYAPKEEQ